MTLSLSFMPCFFRVPLRVFSLIVATLQKIQYNSIMVARYW